MANVTPMPARGRIIENRAGRVIFNPLNTTYRLHLTASGAVDAPEGSRVEGIIRVSAKKLWTVATGGNFIEPIVGPIRAIQGRVSAADEGQIVLHCGAPILVQLAVDDWAMDLLNGPIRMRGMVNVLCEPGATFELAGVVSTPPAAPAPAGA
jgi:hypothetical protein